MMQDACKANITEQLGDQLNEQAKAIQTIRDAGVEIKRFPDEVLVALREASHEVIEEEAAKDPIFKEAYESLTQYIGNVGEWDSLQALPRK